MNLQVLAAIATVLIAIGLAALIGLFIIDRVREAEAPTVEPIDVTRITRPVVRVERSPMVAARRHAVWQVPSRPPNRLQYRPAPVRPTWATWPTAEYAPVPRPRRAPADRPRDPGCTRTEGLPAITAVTR